ncbi:MAG: calcium/proton exchanger [Chloroflexi bacterium]|nr:calcium/proton exchanger [Chloroflexota bacterium]
MKVRTILRENPLYGLLIFVILALIAHFLHWNESLVFLFSALGVVPLAQIIGEATEDLAVHTGPRWGGLINATLGNAAELIITLFAIKRGLLDLVKASITGSILGNLLLVLGASMLAGGIKHGRQRFDQRHVSNSAILAVLAIMALAIPSLVSSAIGDLGSTKVEAFSMGVAGVMLLLYALYLLYNHQTSPEHKADPEHLAHARPVRDALILLGVATVGVAVLSELLVGSVEHVVAQFGVSEFFLGIILIPLIGNVAEHLVAVQQALRNSMDLSVEIAIASSLQIALFVAPALVFISLLLGHPLTLIFHPFEIMALAAAVLIMSLVSMDGESNWLEGVELLAVYTILALAFFLLP